MSTGGGSETPSLRLWRLWQGGERPDVRRFLVEAGELAPAELASVLRVDQEARWRAGVPVPAEDYLRTHPALAADPEAALALVYGEYLLREELGEAPAAAEYLGRFPEYDARLRQQFELHQALRTDLGSDSGAGEGEADTSPHRTGEGGWPELPGYEVVSRLGGGGMGAVYRARHLRLNRLVALKVIHGGALADPEQRARFRVEAEAVARLQHPNVVQIYEVGEHHGVPFLALELVGGGTLAARAAGKPQPPQDAAALVEILARAVHHAHLAGVIHRDLKPANILLQQLATDEHGSKQIKSKANAELASSICFHPCSSVANALPKITDFGLAKRLDGGDGLTATEAILGTPSYMAPEQAEGKNREVGPAADVYALGAILYELLTGRPPFLGETSVATLQQVVTQEPVPPRRLQPAAPRDLETVCLKCLEKQPGRRYASALELAEDLRRFLAGEPVAARPAPWWRRAAKWARRRPAAASLLVLGLATGVFLGVATLLLLDANRREREARDRAEANFQRTLEVVNRFFTRVSEDPELRARGLEPLQRDLLLAAKEYYEKFVQERGDDPKLLAEQARAYGRLAIITAEIGPKAEAIRLYREGAAILERLLRDRRNPAADGAALAALCNNLGVLLKATGDPEGAEQADRRALELRAGLARDEATPDRLADLASSHSNLGNLHFAGGQHERAAAAYGEARALLERVVGERPQSSKYLHLLGQARHNLGGAHAEAGRTAEAEAAYHAALSACRRAVGLDPTNREAWDQLALTLNNLGVAYGSTGRSRLAEKSYAAALETSERLSRRHPRNAEYQHGVGRAAINLGQLYRRTKRPALAEQTYAAGLAALQRLADEHPTVGEYRRLLAVTHGHLGRLAHDQGRTREAEAAYRTSRDLLRAVVRERPDAPANAESLGSCCFDLGKLLLNVLGDPAGARDCFTEAAEAVGPAVSGKGRGGEARAILGKAVGHRAIALTRLGQYEQALADWGRAREFVEGISLLGLVSHRAETVAKARERARGHARAGEHAAAVALAEALTRIAGDSGELCYQAAALHALASAAAGNDAGLAERHAARAVELLGRAQRAGHFDNPRHRDRLREDPDLAPLRCREDFLKLLPWLRSEPKK